MTKRLTGLVLLLAIVITGCAKPFEEETPQFDDDLVIMLEESKYRQAFDQVVREFETKYPGVTVHVREVRFEGGASQHEDPAIYDGVDLVIGQVWFWYQMQRMELLGDMSALDLPPTDPYLVDFHGRLGSTAERSYIPLHFWIDMFGFHEETFRELNLPLPTIDWTYDEFEAAMRAMKEAHKHQPINVDILAQSIVLGHGGGFYSEAEGRWTFNTAQNRAALSFLRRLVEDGLLTTGPGSFNMSVTPIKLSFPEYIEAGYRQLPFPVGPAGRATVVGGGRGAMLVNTTNRPETAAAFLRELFQSTAYAEAGVRPTVVNAAALEVWERTVGEHTARTTEVAWESLRRFPQVAGVNWREDLGRFFKGELSLDELLLGLDARANQ